MDLTVWAMVGCGGVVVASFVGAIVLTRRETFPPAKGHMPPDKRGDLCVWCGKRHGIKRL